MAANFAALPGTAAANAADKRGVTGRNVRFAPNPEYRCVALK